MVLHQKKSNLRAFAIIGLFGTRNVSLKFDKSINILLGENGLGKTTTLNALYYTLTGSFSKLNAIQFERIILDFWNSKSVEISKEDLEFIEHEQSDFIPSRYEREIINLVEYRLSSSDRTTLYSILDKQDSRDYQKDLRNFSYKISASYGLPASTLFRGLMAMFTGRAGKLESIKADIKSKLSEEIIYFPTYRRIEEELHNLGSSKVEFDKKNKLLIQFGMKDVKDTLDEVLLKIKNSAISGFAKITGEMLEQYVDGLNEIDFNTRDKIQPDILKIILERVGDNISDGYKEQIINLVRSQNIFEQEDSYRYLINFLSKLIAVYEEQSEFDNSIKHFVSVCNKYLIGKRFSYNESKVQLSIIHTKEGKETSAIELKSLSSGEKQIISLFAKLYFETGPELIVLFDEPELSLSIEWQRMLLPDVLSSGKCRLLLTVTHSPFVFDNELDEMAEDMSKYVVEK